MTQSNIVRTFITASSLGAVTAILMLAQTGQASAAKSVLNCKGTNRAAVIDCCEDNVRKYGTPLWMRQGGGKCAQTVKCYSRGNTYTAAVAPMKICKIVMLDAAVKSSGGAKDPGGNKTPGRGTPGSSNPNKP